MLVKQRGPQQNPLESLTCAPWSLCGTEVSAKPRPEKILQTKVAGGSRVEQAALNVDYTCSELRAKYAGSSLPSSGPPHREGASKMKGRS